MIKTVAEEVRVEENKNIVRFENADFLIRNFFLSKPQFYNF